MESDNDSTSDSVMAIQNNDEVILVYDSESSQDIFQNNAQDETKVTQNEQQNDNNEADEAEIVKLNFSSPPRRQLKANEQNIPGVGCEDCENVSFCYGIHLSFSYFIGICLD